MTAPDRDVTAVDWHHMVPCELDAAYTRNVTERFDGLTHPPDHDGVPALVDVWAAPEFCGVDLTVSDAGLRLNLTDGEAEALGCILIAEAARARREAGL
jgi:hypothetical protein